MEDSHRHFVQFMLHNGTVTKKQALDFLHKVNPEQNSLQHLKLLIVTTNRHISDQSCKIVTAPCELTNEEMIMWLNMTDDDLTRFQNQFTKLELEYFSALMREILESEDNSITYSFCLNITSTLTDHFTRDNGEKSLKRWLKGGYFVKRKADVFLGPRTIQEFSPYLRGFNNQQNVCSLCSELNFIGQVCNSCYKKYHTLCLRKYFQSQTSCPNCKEDWTGALDVPSEDSQETLDSNNYNSDDSDV